MCTSIIKLEFADGLHFHRKQYFTEQSNLYIIVPLFPLLFKFDYVQILGQALLVLSEQYIQLPSKWSKMPYVNKNPIRP